MTGLDRDTSKSPDRTGVCCTGRCAPSQCETITGPSFSSLNKPDQERTPAYRDSSGSESPSGCLLCYFFRRLGGAIWGIPVKLQPSTRDEFAADCAHRQRPQQPGSARIQVGFAGIKRDSSGLSVGFRERCGSGCSCAVQGPEKGVSLGFQGDCSTAGCGSTRDRPPGIRAGSIA